jgi:arginyl-tRNA synthetase
MKIIEEQVKKALVDGIKYQDPELEIPKKTSFGDYAMPCFQIAKKSKKSPKDVAIELAKVSYDPRIIEKCEAVGPYLNIFVNKQFFAGKVLSQDFTKCQTNGKTVMIEFVSPNTNKPLHLGHVRNMVIGETVSKILDFCGRRVVRSCLFNDRGVHICKSMYAYQMWGNGEEPDEKSDHFVGKYYVKFAKASKDNPDLDEKAQDLLRKWEDGDKQTIKIWNKMNNWAYEGFNETFKNMGISFDKCYYESQIYKNAVKIVKKGLDKGIFTKDDKGNVIAKLTDYGIPDKIILRSDNTSVYITQDIYLAEQKFKDFNLDESIYVVGSEQNLHFRQLFKILQLLDHKYYDKCFHLSYGMVYLPSGKMKSREGIVVDADDIMQKMVNLAKREIQNRHQLQNEELIERARAIGLAALKFHMCKNDAQKDMNFDPEESISFEGETGPYVQYTHARICSILRKADVMPNEKNLGLLSTKEDRKILSLLSGFDAVIAEAADSLKPSKVCRYLLDLSQAFNDYYHTNKIIGVEEPLMHARLYLITAVRKALAIGLEILSIKALEEM